MIRCDRRVRILARRLHGALVLMGLMPCAFADDLPVPPIEHVPPAATKSVPTPAFEPRSVESGAFRVRIAQAYVERDDQGAETELGNCGAIRAADMYTASIQWLRELPTPSEKDRELFISYRWTCDGLSLEPLSDLSSSLMTMFTLGLSPMKYHGRVTLNVSVVHRDVSFERTFSREFDFDAWSNTVSGQSKAAYVGAASGLLDQFAGDLRHAETSGSGNMPP